MIGPLINSLLTQDYPSDLYDIWVVPNNCTDNTALAAHHPVVDGGAAGHGGVVGVFAVPVALGRSGPGHPGGVAGGLCAQGGYLRRAAPHLGTVLHPAPPLVQRHPAGGQALPQAAVPLALQGNHKSGGGGGGERGPGQIAEGATGARRGWGCPP